MKLIGWFEFFYIVDDLLRFVPVISHGLNYISLLCGFHTNTSE